MDTVGIWDMRPVHARFRVTHVPTTPQGLVSFLKVVVDYIRSAGCEPSVVWMSPRVRTRYLDALSPQAWTQVDESDWNTVEIMGISVGSDDALTDHELMVDIVVPEDPCTP